MLRLFWRSPTGSRGIAGRLAAWTDVARSGDTYTTNAGLDATLPSGDGVSSVAQAYAGGGDLYDPLMSPLYADYTRGYPRTLITTGTRDLLLSDCVRLSTVMRAAGVSIQLNVWEAMSHVFEFYPELPEARESLREVAAFLARHLGLSSTA